MQDQSKTPARFIQSLSHGNAREYAQAHLAWIREEREIAPWYGQYGLGHKDAQAIARRLGTLPA